MRLAKTIFLSLLFLSVNSSCYCLLERFLRKSSNKSAVAKTTLFLSLRGVGEEVIKYSAVAKTTFLSLLYFSLSNVNFRI